MKILVIDNFDSFTYNLVHYLEDLGATVTVVRNNEIPENLSEIYDRLVLSPGPGLPEESGDLMKVIERYHAAIPILGICLGHQALATYFGEELFNLPDVYHGLQRTISVNQEHPVFKDLKKETEVGLYHSWAMRPPKKESIFSVIALSGDDIVMGIQHKTLPIIGLQFHPESIMTKEGKKMLENWLSN